MKMQAEEVLYLRYEPMEGGKTMICDALANLFVGVMPWHTFYEIYYRASEGKVVIEKMDTAEMLSNRKIVGRQEATNIKLMDSKVLGAFCNNPTQLIVSDNLLDFIKAIKDLIVCSIAELDLLKKVSTELSQETIIKALLM